MDEMDLAHREDSQTQRDADDMIRQIDQFLRRGHRVSPRLRALLAATRADLKALSDHIVAVWN